MSNNKSFDVVIIGGGPGGYVAAIRTSQNGLTTALVEKRARAGGTCSHTGCIPSKALLDSSKIYEKVSKKLNVHGIHVEGIHLNLSEMMSRKNKIVR